MLGKALAAVTVELLVGRVLEVNNGGKKTNQPRKLGCLESLTLNLRSYNWKKSDLFIK